MTTSGSRNFTVSRSELIQEALANIGALDPGNTLSPEESARASIRLNLMIKGWMARGANLWRREELILFLQSGQRSYKFGTDHFAKVVDVVETTLTAPAAAAAVDVIVASTAGMSPGDVLGIKLDDGSIHWPLPGVFPNPSPTLTFITALPSAASIGNPVYSYPFTGVAAAVNNTINPIKVSFAFRRDQNGNDTPVRLIALSDYNSLSIKGSSGPVTCIHHDRKLVSEIKVWPVVNTDIDKLHLIVDRTIEDFDAAVDTPDFPVEWLNALMWGLSAELSNTYGLPIQERQWLRQGAAVEFEAANSFDIEETTVRLEYGDS